MLTGHENLCGIDLDWCFDPATGLLRPWAQEIVDSCGSYTEFSPTEGKGVHVWGIVDDDIPTLGFNLKMGDGDQHVEVYVRGGGGTLFDRHRQAVRRTRGQSPIFRRSSAACSASDRSKTATVPPRPSRS